MKNKTSKASRSRKAPVRPRVSRPGSADGAGAVVEKIAAMPAPWRAMGERLHALITTTVPGLSPRLWFGLPGYAKNGAVICFFRGGHTFKERYLTLGFNNQARLDDGDMWPTYFAVLELTPAVEARIAALVKTAAG